jgi:hypothetical protein
MEFIGRLTKHVSVESFLAKYKRDHQSYLRAKSIS